MLSPGTEPFDRAEKFAGYRSVEPLRRYMMVSSQEVMVEQYLRHDDGSWTLRVFSLGDVLTFAAPDLRLAVDDLYERAFDAVASQHTTPPPRRSNTLRATRDRYALGSMSTLSTPARCACSNAASASPSA